MFTMNIFGISIVAILGFINLMLLVFQLLTGLHLVKARINIHKTTGIILVVVALIHGILAMLSYF